MEDLVAQIESSGVADMFRFIRKQPAARIPDFISACDVAFLSLTDSPVFAMTVPAKIQSYMACGIPIVASVAGEPASIILESGSGLCSPPGDPVSLARNILSLAEASEEERRILGKNGKAYSEENFNKKALLDRMDICFAQNQP